MKKNNLKLLLIVLIIIIACIVNIFVPGKAIFTETNLNYLLFWGIILGLIILIMGFEKNRSIYQVDVIQITFIYCISYFVATYIFGFFFGFIRSPYSLEFETMFQNIFPVIIIILLQELVRHMFATKGKDKILILILLIISFSAFDITIALKSFVYSDALSLFEFIGTIIIGSIARNTILTYLATKAGFKVTIMYRLIFETTIYIIPIFPDLGPYLQSLLEVLFPAVLFLHLNAVLANFKLVPRNARVKKLKNFFIQLPTYAFILIVFILISGLFKIYAMAIVSNSMRPAFQRGDMVIIEKLNDKQIENLVEGEIIAFQFQGRIITHRIHEIKERNGKIFYTKGDNNDEVDKWEVTPDSIKGQIRYRVPYIGYPSVWIYELIH